MKSLRFRLTLLGGALLMLAFTSVASAQATRTWVSGVGDDANPCSRTAPCKTFAGAISKTADKGEIDCLDPGGFGAVTITKNITIDCDSGAGGVLNAGFNGIIISAGTGVVQLRNLNIQGAGSGLDGIKVIAAGAVHLDDVIIMGQNTNGIEIAVSAATSLSGRDVKINNCANALNVTSSSGNASVELTNSQLNGNVTGVFAGTNSLITLRDTTVSLNNTGIFQSAARSQINLVHSQFSSNATAVVGANGSTIRIVNNVFSQNGTALNSNSGTIFTDGTNVNDGNGIPGGTTTPLPAPILL